MISRSDTPLLECRGLCKHYPGVKALDDVSFSVYAGSVHALVGENGAGKSTLTRCLCGLERPDGGSMLRDGAAYAPLSRSASEALGVRMVLQELNILDTLTVAENLFFDRLPVKCGLIDRATLRSMSVRALERVGLSGFDPDLLCSHLGVGQKQMVEIAAGLARECRVLVLDEPTASLTQSETVRLFEQIRQLRADGMGIVYISHRMKEILQIADYVSVMRDGHMIDTLEANGLQLDSIIHLMVGRELKGEMEDLRGAHDSRGRVALRVEGLRHPPMVHDVSFDLHHGEIVGLAGLVGAGRTESVRCLFGADRPTGGNIYLGESTVPIRIKSPRQAVSHGIALIPEDRKSQGLLLPLAIRANITLAHMRSVVSGLSGWISPNRERHVATDYAQRLGVKCSGIEQAVGHLSGGNQQKTIIARWLLRDCNILIFDEPTRGIDMGARVEIYKLIRHLATVDGKAVLIVSSDMMELSMICDRIVVLSAGYSVAEFARGEWTSEKIMEAALLKHLGDKSSVVEGNTVNE